MDQNDSLYTISGCSSGLCLVNFNQVSSQLTLQNPPVFMNSLSLAIQTSYKVNHKLVIYRSLSIMIADLKLKYNSNPNGSKVIFEINIFRILSNRKVNVNFFPKRNSIIRVGDVTISCKTLDFILI